MHWTELTTSLAKKAGKFDFVVVVADDKNDDDDDESYWETTNKAHEKVLTSARENCGCISCFWVDATSNAI